MAEESKASALGDAGIAGSSTDRTLIAITLLCGILGLLAGLFTAVFFLAVIPALDFIGRPFQTAAGSVAPRCRCTPSRSECWAA